MVQSMTTDIASLMLESALEQADKERNDALLNDFKDQTERMGAGESVYSEHYFASLIRREDGVEIVRSATDQMIHRAQVYKEALGRLVQTQTNVGRAVLIGMWQFHKEAMIIFMGDNGQEYDQSDFQRWMNEAYSDFSDNEKYISQLAFIVDRVIAAVDRAQTSGNPYILEDGTPVTAEMLVQGHGLIKRLIMMSGAFAASDGDRESQILLLDAALNKGLVDLKSITSSVLDGDGSNSKTGSKRIRLPYRVIDTADPDKVQVIFEVSIPGKLLIEKLIGAAGQLLLD